MKRVFVNSSLKEEVLLDTEQTHHILRVFRHDTNKALPFVSAEEGTMANYEFVSMEGKESLWHRVSDVLSLEKKAPIVLIQSLLKGEKLEFILQKAVELEADAVFLVGTAHSVAKLDESKAVKKKERWEKIMWEAAQQSGRSFLPNLIIAKNIPNLLELKNQLYPDICSYIAYENEEGLTLKKALQDGFPTEGVCCMIGPEGGLGAEEVEELCAAGFTSVSLGDTILRAETAAIYAISVLHFIRS